MSYIDLSGTAISRLANSDGMKHAVEAIATELRDEIVYQMDPGPVRTGEEYTVPGTGTIDPETGRRKRGTGRTYTASAPGEPPAVRTGAYAAAWQVSPAVVRGDKVMAAAVNDRKTEDDAHFIGEILEFGTNDGRIAPRPHIRPAMDAVAQRHGGKVRTGE